MLKCRAENKADLTSVEIPDNAILRMSQVSEDERGRQVFSAIIIFLTVSFEIRTPYSVVRIRQITDGFIPQPRVRINCRVWSLMVVFN